MTRNITKGTVWLGIAAVACLLLSGTVAQASLNNGLVSYWPLDGDVVDARGSNDGTIIGADLVGNYTAGQFGDGIDLDGIDQAIDVGNDVSLDMSVATGAAGNGHVSMSAWFRVDGFTKDWQALIAKGEGSNYRVARRGGDQEIAYAGGSGEGPASGLNVNDGALHHMVAISEDGVSTRLWVDGVLQSTGGAPSINNEGNNAGSNEPLLIGSNPQTGNRTWDGLIDDVGIWNRPLTEGEIGFLWNGGDGNLIPEPTSAVLAICGLMGLGLLGRRRHSG